jgi:cytochrome c oxidase accessory protein FixG
VSEPAPRLIDAPERVLPTLNQDGTRRWIRPRPAHGAFWSRRRAVAWALMVVFFAVPYLRMNGRPLILLDLPRREFSLFGTTFLPTETVLFQLLFLSAAIGIVLFTALFGRVWCGWGCPQTVYMEFLFRPLEYALEGGPAGVRRLDAAGGLPARRALKYVLFGLLALFLAHTFLGYFVGVEQLVQWVRRSPVEHPTAFLVMAGTTALILLDFAWFREQTCLVACPYGRLQSVLLDRRSLIVAYDARRGEPRGRLGARPPLAVAATVVGGGARPAGDCVDCGMCVQACPTGIDIRDGLQMECIHCTQCMDACDAVMARVGRAGGLIRYGSRDEMDGRPFSRLRPRVLIYPVALAATLGLLAWQLGTRAPAEVTVLRAQGAPFTLEPDGRVVNQVRLRIANRGAAAERYAISLAGADPGALIAPINPFPVPAHRTAETSVFIALPPSAFRDGRRDVVLRVESAADAGAFARNYPWRLAGPSPHPEAP